MVDMHRDTDGRPKGAAESHHAERPGVDRETGERQLGTADDWTVAALAHASVLLTSVSVFAGGVGALIGLVVPLVVYLSYRERSRFVGFQALQALVYQGVCVLAYLVIAAVLALGVTAVWIVTGLLSVVAVGFLLIPAALLITGLMIVVLLVAPLAWTAYGLYAAYQVYQGRAFRYWLIGEWLEREVNY